MVLINVWLPHRSGGAGFWKLGGLLAVAPVLFSVALSRFGHTVLLRLPSVPFVGGAWTLEALLFGASTGMALLLVVIVFAILRSAVRSPDLISLLPAPLYGAGTAFALAVAFAPQTVGSMRAISEARRLRGQRSGWRGAPSLLVPLLLTTMERALQYGESLDARGFGSRRRSRYRPRQWHAADYLVVVASAGSLLIVLHQGAIAYNPYLELTPSFPGADSLVAVLALALPAILAGIRWRRHATDLV
jgi:energy-coupling factor transport system permease protein